MAIILDGSNGVTTPSVNSSSNLISTVVSSPTSLSLKTNGSTTAVTIDTSQNVGIGTATPSYKLDVSGTGRIGNGVAQGDPNSTNVLANTHTILSGTGGNYLAFGQYASNNSYAQWIQSAYQNPTTATYNLVLNPLGGNVGIGTSSPTNKLTLSSGWAQVGNGIGGAGGVWFPYSTGSADCRTWRIRSDVAGYGDWGIEQSTTQTGTAYATKLLITQAGEFLFGTTSLGGTGWSLYPTGYSITNGATSTFTHISFQTSSAQKGYIQTVGSTTNYNGSSDYRLKENIEVLPNALQTIAQLKPVKFNWKEDGSVAYSFIAHELQEVIPQAVGGTKDEVDENGKPVYQGIDPSKLVCFLTAAIQELKAINDTQAETINTLTARIEALENK